MRSRPPTTPWKRTFAPGMSFAKSVKMTTWERYSRIVPIADTAPSSTRNLQNPITSSRVSELAATKKNNR